MNNKLGLTDFEFLKISKLGHYMTFYDMLYTYILYTIYFYLNIY